MNELECSFCLKHKDGCVVEFADQKSGESALCWGCLKKMAQMKHRMLNPTVTPAAAKPIPTAIPAGNNVK